MRIRTFALLATFLLPLSLAAESYTYTGNDFILVGNFSSPPVYSTSDFVTITFTTAAPLPDNLGPGEYGDFVAVVPLSWSFSDGVQSDNSTDPNAHTEFYLITNASGQIVDWYMSDDWPSTLHGAEIDSGYNSYNDTSVDFAADPEGDYASSIDYYDPVGIPGTWSAVTTTPEAPSFVLLLLGGACLCGAGYLRSRKRASSLTV
jgi:hypothetical protein